MPRDTLGWGEVLLTIQDIGSRLRQVYGLLIAGCVLLVIIGAPQRAVGLAQGGGRLELSTRDGRFTVNGTPRFLVFVSYFDALDADDAALASDFAWLKSKGVDGIRIFPNWWTLRVPPPTTYTYAQDTVIGPGGLLRTAPGGPVEKLLTVLDLAKRYGLLVDVSLTAETVGDCPSDDCEAFDAPIRSVTLEEYGTAIGRLVGLLAGRGDYRHVLIDAQNEASRGGNHPSDGPLTVARASALRQAVTAADPRVPVTISRESNSEGPADAARFSEAVGLSAIAWHGPQDSSWPEATRQHIEAMRRVSALPIYFQEPIRYPNPRVTVERLRRAVFEAYRAGAAGWCFHSGAGFFLNGTSLQANLAPLERSFIERLSETLTCASTDGCEFDAAPR
jgi:hypothetical protein